MPELPEVETMVRGLRPALVGRTLRDVRLLDPFLLQGCEAEEFEGAVRGSVVERIDRRGKWVAIALAASRGIIVIQPRMTGGFWLVQPGRPEHIRLTLHLDGSPETVWFCDTRRLGKIAWHSTLEDAETAFRRSHGPDALTISAADLAGRLSRTDRAVKPALMDQKVLAGLGNIYADETLFVAGIHPSRPAASLTKVEVARIVEAIGGVLNQAIGEEGSSFDRHYRTVLGGEGGYLSKYARVYGRKDQPCRLCSAAVEKIKLTGLIGRPTHFCPRCQPVKPPRRSPKR